MNITQIIGWKCLFDFCTYCVVPYIVLRDNIYTMTRLKQVNCFSAMRSQNLLIAFAFAIIVSPCIPADRNSQYTPTEVNHMYFQSYLLSSSLFMSPDVNVMLHQIV